MTTRLAKNDLLNFICQMTIIVSVLIFTYFYIHWISVAIVTLVAVGLPLAVLGLTIAGAITVKSFHARFAWSVTALIITLCLIEWIPFLIYEDCYYNVMLQDLRPEYTFKENGERNCSMNYFPTGNELTPQ